MNLLIFGYGYTSQALVRYEGPRFAHVAATVRSPEKAAALARDGLAVRVFSDSAADPELAQDIAAADAVLVSIPPDGTGDPVLRRFERELAAAPSLRWVGYLSTVGVYGDHGGDWVDGGDATAAAQREIRATGRGGAGLAGLRRAHRQGGPDLPACRASTVPARTPSSTWSKARRGASSSPARCSTAFTSRISRARSSPRWIGRSPGAIYNVTDDEPAPPQDVVAYAAGLMGMPVPPDLPFESAPLSPMGRSFYGENKRVSNAVTKRELGWVLRHPTYREALTSLRAEGDGG